MIIIQLELYGDFNMPYTDSLWIHDSLTSFGPASLETDIDGDEGGIKTKAELIQLGFRPVKNRRIIGCGGNS